ncbi:glycoside hydrolase family 16 protein [Mycena belliarum]|uniref:Glycoside hydrolase family 16 protein n=1 Tax=Mycena belliarum TaxID=1033014 RepID=A0AAD6UE40_9AGAR|nr:glycoside hydrolase family 16 protein [Mycena belliae]
MARDNRHSASSTSLANSVTRNSAAAALHSPSQTALHTQYQNAQYAQYASPTASVHELGAPTPPFASGTNTTALPRTSSQTFRAPFLSPASRPSSSLWAPPSYSPSGAHLSSLHPGSPSSPGTSALALALPAAPAPAPSTRLAGKLTAAEKPWLARPPPRARASWWLTLACMLLGLAGAAALCYFGMQGVDVFGEGELCRVLRDDFSGNGGELDTENTWVRDVQMGGFGNAEFQITTAFANNSYIKNSQLYLMPTLTSAAIGDAALTSGAAYTVPGCTEAQTNKTACSAAGGAGAVVNPVMSARISTKGRFEITYGRVEVRAKLPRGDWLWPAIWMLPSPAPNSSSSTSTWPLTGELDLMEARGNGPAYPAQGSNFVRSTVSYGPLPSVVARLFGWYGLKRTAFDRGFHTYGLEWDARWLRFYVDSRVHSTLDLSTKKSKESFWARAGFPATAQNGSAVVPLANPYESVNAPFDKPFYLIIDLAVGGTSGWFPDRVGGKPWFDGSLSAMADFWAAKDTWFATWPESDDDRAFRMCVFPFFSYHSKGGGLIGGCSDSVNMWKKC